MRTNVPYIAPIPTSVYRDLLPNRLDTFWQCEGRAEDGLNRVGIGKKDVSETITLTKSGMRN